MDQSKIGAFLAQLRREKGMTQRQLADSLLISDKTVSKWECGKGLPEVSLMLPLCEMLEISVNELLSGERLDQDRYRLKAEENMMKLVSEKEENKRKILLSILVALITVVCGCVLILIVGLETLSLASRIALVAVAVVIIVCGIALACVLDRTSGVYECTKCGKQFVPDLWAYIMGPHTLTRRSLRCPHCGKKSYCIRRLTFGENADRS